MFRILDSVSCLLIWQVWRPPRLARSMLTTKHNYCIVSVKLTKSIEFPSSSSLLLILVTRFNTVSCLQKSQKYKISRSYTPWTWKTKVKTSCKGPKKPSPHHNEIRITKWNWWYTKVSSSSKLIFPHVFIFFYLTFFPPTFGIYVNLQTFVCFPITCWTITSSRKEKRAFPVWMTVKNASWPT